MISYENSIPRPEYPQPEWQRDDWTNLNGTWEFRFDPDNKGLSEQWYLHNILSTPEQITVPFSWVSPMSGIHKDIKGTGWYNRVVRWKPEQPESRIFIRFGAVDYSCQVWINGNSVGTHTGGYGSFEFDVTRFWNADSENLIVVRAEDNDLGWQTRGKQGYGEIRGIWQPVWLEAKARNYIGSLRFHTHLDGIIEAEGIIHAAHAAVSTLLFTFDGGKVSHRLDLSLVDGINSFKTSFKVADPILWDTDNPYLYEGTVELDNCKEGTDRVSTYFGIREIGTAVFGDREYPWITLNGKPVFLNGTLDQSFNPKGCFTYPSDEEMRNEIWRLKRLGLNFVRIHIKPEEPRKLYWADKLGMLVMEDMPCFWGAPDAQARSSYESEAHEIIARDINHPSIFSWVMFNETWGLFSKGEDGRNTYKPETRKWVSDMYHMAKGLDPTRLVEDNSACNYDHVVSDLNTWHFYINGYNKVREHIDSAVKQTCKGSSWNYIGENRQTGAPLMNSECGAVWGIEGSAGDSDIAWHYRYMINEFRRHDKLCGFIFTEFHDVVNEFNGYYRIDNSDKDFGYHWFNKDMSLTDMHSPDFLVVDAPPCTTVKTGEKVIIPLLASSYSDRYHSQKLNVVWELWYDNLGEKEILDAGKQSVEWDGYGVHPLLDVSTAMPESDAIAVFAVRLETIDGTVITRNFTTFDVRSGRTEGSYDIKGGWLSIPPAQYRQQEWEYSWEALNQHKVNGVRAGFFEYDIDLTRINMPGAAAGMEIIFEAGSKIILGKDKELITAKPHDISYMHGAKADPGMNINSYFMTDEKRQASEVEVLINGETVESMHLPDDPADSRGVLSWHYQASDTKLEEAGSYGYLQKVKIPSRLVADIMKKGSFKLVMRVPDTLPEGEGGLALYGRNAGRYPIDILIRYW